MQPGLLQLSFDPRHLVAGSLALRSQGRRAFCFSGAFHGAGGVDAEREQTGNHIGRRADIESGLPVAGMIKIQRDPAQQKL